MIGKVLTPEEGISHDVFKDAEEEEEVQPEEENLEEGAEANKKVKDDDILKTMKHIYVSEVVREPRIHFYKVPRLGSFLAIPLIYKSCLHSNALD